MWRARASEPSSESPNQLSGQQTDADPQQGQELAREGEAGREAEGRDDADDREVVGGDAARQALDEPRDRASFEGRQQEVHLAFGLVTVGQ